jgi:ABC-type sulfate transport system permease component
MSHVWQCSHDLMHNQLLTVIHSSTRASIGTSGRASVSASMLALVLALVLVLLLVRVGTLNQHIVPLRLTLPKHRF